MLEAHRHPAQKFGEYFFVLVFFYHLLVVGIPHSQTPLANFLKWVVEKMCLNILLLKKYMFRYGAANQNTKYLSSIFMQKRF